MKAIVLTFDKYKIIAAHMLDCYLSLWKDCPLVFRIPYQAEETKSFFKSKYGEHVELIKSNPGIVDTVNTLIDGINDEEWIYWCLDDRYVVEMNYEAYNNVYHYISSGKVSTDVCAFMMNNKSQHKTPRYLYPHKNDIMIDDIVFRRRKTYRMIWGHQFCRVKVIRSLFSYINPSIKSAKEMDHMVHIHLPPKEQFLMIVNRSEGQYEESTSRGMVNINTLESLNRFGYGLPEGFKCSGKRIIYGYDTWFSDLFANLRYYKNILLHGKLIKDNNGEY